MTEVLSIAQPNGPKSFGSPLRRTSSQSSFRLNAPPYSRGSLYPNQRYAYNGYDTRQTFSEPSTAPSSPRLAPPDFSRQHSYISTPSSILSLDDHGSTKEDEISFPSYDDYSYLDTATPKEAQATPTDLPLASSTPPTAVADAPTQSSAFESNRTAADDMAIKSEPTRHVDYLAHTWKEEDIWASWRYIVARRDFFSNSARLENASWRSWTKSKYHLKMIPADSLNWCGECSNLQIERQANVSQDEGP